MRNSEDNASQTGIQIAVELIHNIKHLVQGIYLMPAFNRYDCIAEIIENIKQ